MPFQESSLRKRSLKVLHVIIGLNVGGAEMMLKRLVEADALHGQERIVVSLTSLGTLGKSICDQGIDVHSLGMKSIFDFPTILSKLFKLIRQIRPQVVQTWMYHADLLGGLAARMAGSCILVWGIRSTSIPHGPLSVTYWLVRICAILSYVVPHKIVCNANVARKAHIELGFSARKICVIGNGFDFSELGNSAVVRASSRGQLGFKENEIVIGVAGRFDPLKDFGNFISAAAKLMTRTNNVRFLMVGRDLDESNETLTHWIENARLSDRIVMVGEQLDIPFYYSAMDIFCLSSRSEGFPNVLVEALAMGLPCVATNAGDAADILGNTEFVVPTQNADALCDAMLRMCNLGDKARRAVGDDGANRVRLAYDIQKVRCDYQRLYSDLVHENAINPMG